MNIIFRTDVSIDIGTGHVMRCLTLAQALREQGANCRFICREHAGNLLDLIRQRGFEAQALPMQVFLQEKLVQQGAIGKNILAHAAWLGADWQTDAEQTKDAIGDVVVDWLIVDHYALDVRWEDKLKPYYRKVMVIDDLADRPHTCDLLLDQNLGRQVTDYALLVPKHCTVLAGPQYALLRPEFAALREYSLKRRETPVLKQILITMGGVDQPNATEQVLTTLKSCPLPEDCTVTVVMGSHAPWLNRVREVAQSMPWKTKVQVNITNMAQVMADSDLAIGAAGGTAWERCTLVLPTIIIVTADNQRPSAMALASKGAARVLMSIDNIDRELGGAINSMMEMGLLTTMQQVCKDIIDGNGTDRAVSALLSHCGNDLCPRLVTADDERLLFDWANDPLTRAQAFNTDDIPLDTHRAWLETRLANPDCYLLYIIENHAEVAVGQVRFELNENHDWVIDYALAPDLRGQGLGRKLLCAGLTKLDGQYPGCAVIGHVKQVNLPSQAIFESLGFSHDKDENNEFIIYKCILGGVQQ
jgi:UDP-2,4-diacetamido-2,4,6-trideoxy-beta-L-altropyranose hydrolase